MELLRLRELLKEKNVTGKDLAERLEVNPNTISRIANGSSFPSGDLLFKVAKELDIDIRELFYPTKDVDIHALPSVNGFVEFNNETYRIKNAEDLEKLLLKMKGS